jgi:hypothetical protein
LPVALAPILSAIEPGASIPRDAKGTATITITCQPRVRIQQQAVLLVAGTEVVGKIDPGNPDKLIFVIEGAPTTDAEQIRLRVDGIESLPFKRVDTPPPTRFEFDANQQVKIT